MSKTCLDLRIERCKQRTLLIKDCRLFRFCFQKIKRNVTNKVLENFGSTRGDDNDEDNGEVFLQSL